jgi:hypothetical protein
MKGTDSFVMPSLTIEDVYKILATTDLREKTTWKEKAAVLAGFPFAPSLIQKALKSPKTATYDLAKNVREGKTIVRRGRPPILKPEENDKLGALILVQFEKNETLSPTQVALAVSFVVSIHQERLLTCARLRISCMSPMGAKKETSAWFENFRNNGRITTSKVANWNSRWALESILKTVEVF